MPPGLLVIYIELALVAGVAFAAGLAAARRHPAQPGPESESCHDRNGDWGRGRALGRTVRAAAGAACGFVAALSAWALSALLCSTLAVVC